MVWISNHSGEIMVLSHSYESQLLNHSHESWSLNHGPEYLTANVVEFKYYYNKYSTILTDR